MSTAPPDTTAASERATPLGPSVLVWLPALVLGAGLALGMMLWGKWGFAIAFEAIRTYCF